VSHCARAGGAALGIVAAPPPAGGLIRDGDANRGGDQLGADRP
jgi:hypothetical protein